MMKIKYAIERGSFSNIRKWMAQIKLGISNKNHANLGFTFTFEIDACKRPQLIFNPVKGTHPSNAQINKIPTQISHKYSIEQYYLQNQFQIQIMFVVRKILNPKIICPSFFSSTNELSAKKYLRSLSQTALMYRPSNIRELQNGENLHDRVVQNFFDTSNFAIQVAESADRLQSVTQFSTPAHSFYQLRLPFSQNHHLRKKMIQFSSNTIRIGRMLELMDYIAANVAYRYCSPSTQTCLPMDELSFIAVTASIDEIEYYHPISVDTDVTLSGHVSYVGKSSMEIGIDVVQEHDGLNRLCCSAKFVMVARDKKTGKSHTVPTLNQDHEKQTFRILNELAQARQATRKIETSKALQFSPPSYQESVIIHNLMQSMKKCSKPHDYLPISSTTQKNTMLMHNEDKNLSGKIFGGLILRLAYELGWLCVVKFLKNIPRLTHVDDVQFLAPIQIGTYVDFCARIGYVTDRYLHVVISCHNAKFTGEKTLTDILRVTFEHGIDADKVQRVYPETLQESYLYIQSMRRVQKMING